MGAIERKLQNQKKPYGVARRQSEQQRAFGSRRELMGAKEGQRDPLLNNGSEKVIGRHIVL